MYPMTCYPLQWHYPMYNNWNKNNWSHFSNQYDYYRNNHNWNAHYYNGNNNWNHYYENTELKDYGGKPFVINIEKASKLNNNYRTALWTGNHLQVTLMSIDVGGDIGLEVHPKVDQFIRIEQGQGLVQMGNSKNHLDFEKVIFKDDAIMIPAGTWHNLTNMGNIPIKLYTIYAPPQHPFGTVHKTKKIAMEAEEINT